MTQRSRFALFKPDVKDWIQIRDKDKRQLPTPKNKKTRLKRLISFHIKRKGRL